MHPAPLEPATETQAESARGRVRRYHEGSKHRLDRYAPGPETLDWDGQPSPFRRFAGAALVSLPSSATSEGKLAESLALPLGAAPDEALPFSLAALGVLFELSLGITAWKTMGPDRWAVRANPSSGNLHPVEAYALISATGFLDAGVYHYAPDEHALEQRARWQEPGTEPRVWIALTTILWREAWKYGERAFRYCELDIGHALAALGYAARLLGWRLTDASHVGWGALFGALGLDREQDFPKRVRNYTELEEPELLVEVVRDASHPPISAAELARLTASASFAGTPSVIDAHPMYAWPAIHDVAAATRWPSREHSRAPAPEAALQHARSDMPAARLISSRRSAQRFDSRFVMEREAFLRLIAAAAANPACAALFPSPMVDLVLWVHRVEGVEPGVYVLPRTSERPLLTWLSRKFEVRPVASGEVGVELFRVAAVAPRELSRIARTLCCHQDIASSCAFAVAMVADIERALALDAFAYRLVHREAGAVGQALYLEAEAAGVRGTGIGCFLDDPTAEFLGVADTPARSVYHFSVGKPIDDPRIETTRAGVLAKANGEEDK